jgi:hypothetical protein
MLKYVDLLFTVFNLSCRGRTEIGLSISSLMTIYSAILIGLEKCSMMMKGGIILSKYEYDAKYSKK